jgi:hypothetical protein
MANENGWGDGSVNNNIGWGQSANNNIGWGNSQLTSWSGSTDIDGGNLPVNTVAPAITGTAQEGQTLTCSTGTWSGSNTYTYQWKRNGSNIGSATNSTYTLVTADVGQSIKCTVTATNFVGSANADSNTVVPISAFSFLLDTYSGAAAAYSLRKLRSTYSGSSIRVRRSSDNTEQDFGFVNNILDTASLLSFVGAGNGFVTTWYDQSGNARNILQSTAANQPQIVSSGSVLVHNSKPAMTFDGTNDAFSRDLSGFATTSQFFVLNTPDTMYLYPHYQSTNYGWVAQQGQSSSGLPNGYGSPSLYVNNSLFSGTTRNDVYNSLNGYKAVCHQGANAFPIWEFGNYSGFNFACNFQEFVYYGSNQNANRTGIFSNINTFYSIY